MSMETIYAIVRTLYFHFNAENINVSFEDGRYLIEIEGDIISDDIKEDLNNL